MAQWEYTTIGMGTPDKNGRKWVITAPDAETAGKQIGEAEKPRFIGRFWQGMRLLETALKEMDADGWELVSCLREKGGLFRYYLKRPAS